MARIHEIGKMAEAEAWVYLSARRDLHLLERNYRWKGGEIDLIAEEHFPGGRLPELVFVEVRARRAGSWVGGVESVDWKKRVRIRRTMEHYLARYDGIADSVRFDVMAWDGWAWFHLPDAWVFH